MVEQENHKMEEATRLQLSGESGDREKLLKSIFSPAISEEKFQAAETLQQLQDRLKIERGENSKTNNKHLPDMQPKEDPLEEIRKRKLETGSAYKAKRP